MKQMFVISLCALALTGCSVVPEGIFKKKPEPKPEGEPLILPVDIDDTGREVITEEARTVEEFDNTTTEERTAAVEGGQSSGGERALGKTVASLGAVSEGGIWVKTPLVSKAGKGRVVYGKNGRSLAVDLMPLDGAAGSGSQISLAAMRLLDADLTSLPELQVYAKN